MNRYWLTLCVLILGGASLMWSAQAENGKSKEQLLFSAEDETFDHPLPIPRGVLEILRKDTQVLQYLEAVKKSPDELTGRPFLASQVHLDGPDELDLIVMGIDRLRGANVATFWVFRSLNNQFELVLKITAHGLRVETSRWKGLRNIEAGTVTGSKVYIDVHKFDGTRYKLYHSKSTAM